jgi:tetratricopeptide (TPR) repeat protein
MHVRGILVIRKAAIAVLVCLLLAQTAFAADPPLLYQQGVEKLYNLYFDEAEANFKSLTKEFPDDPLYWNSLASTIWTKILYSQQKLNIESFSLKDTFGTSQSRDELAAAEEKRLTDTIAKAIEKADKLLKKNPRDVHALYAEGASYAALATFHATVKRSYTTARSEAAKARDFHKQVLEIDPNYHDAEMSIGAYNYVMGILPWMFRMTFNLVGIGGDGKDIGIQQIENTARMGNQGATDAKMLLLIVYNREGRHSDALKLVDELHAKYPRNFLFEMSRAQILRKMGKGDRANETYLAILRKVTLKIDGYERLRMAKVYYDLAKSQAEQGDFSTVYATYLKVVDPKSDATPNERADSQIWMGMILDSQKNRSGALEHYNAVDTLQCDAVYKDRANEFKKRAYQSKS